MKTSRLDLKKTTLDLSSKCSTLSQLKKVLFIKVFLCNYLLHNESSQRFE